MSNTDPLTIFRTLTTIPRDSGDEKKVAEYLISFAEKRGLEAVKDDADNVITENRRRQAMKKPRFWCCRVIRIWCMLRVKTAP